MGIKIEKMRHLKTDTVSVIVGVLGMMKKWTDKHINSKPGSYSQYEIQKCAICGTDHLYRVLSML